MTKQYKRKRMVGMENDNNHNRKSLNASERQRGKSAAVSGQKDYEKTIDDRYVTQLRWDLEMHLADECWRKEITCQSTGLAETLQRLGVGRFNLHKCTCPLPEKLSDKEILKHFGH